MLVACQPPAQPPVSVSSAPPALVPIQIPKVAASAGDWTAQALQVRFLTPVGAQVVAKAQLAVAWTPDALLLQVHTDDATPEASSVNPWENDSVEVFLASSPGAADHLQLVCTPGRTADHSSPTWTIVGKNSTDPSVIAPKVEAQKEGSGYRLTLTLPWANLKHVPQPGEVIGLQVNVNDAQGDGKIAHRLWYPQSGTYADWTLVQPVRLAAQASEAQEAAAWSETKGIGETLHLSAPAEEVGKPAELWLGAQKVGSILLTAGGPDGATGSIALPMEITARKGEQLIVTLEGHPLAGGVVLPDLMGQWNERLRALPLAAHNAIFDGATFPTIDFANKEVIEAAIGEYSLHTRFFDATWNEVTAPAAPGRYGAIVEFHGPAGLSFQRDLTLFKTAKPYASRSDPYRGTLQFPAAFGLPADLAAKEAWNSSYMLNDALSGQAQQDDEEAVLAAGMQDLATDPARWHGFYIWASGDAWWAELHKRLGENQDYAHLIYLPDGYDKDQRPWPLILFLHGSGERGTDPSILENWGPRGYIHQGHPLPFIVVSPQCPPHEWWNPARLARLLDQLSATYRVDPKRIYVTGLSMGGYGSFDLAATYPERIAAIAPLSGGENPALAERLKHMPAWIFHGATDDVVPTRYSVDLAQAMEQAGAPVKLTIYPGVGHGGWDVTYNNPRLYEWFLQNTR